MDAIIPNQAAGNSPDGAAAASPVAGKEGVIESLLVEGFKLEDFERELLQKALSKTNGNVSRAARLVGMSRPTFSYRIKKIMR